MGSEVQLVHASVSSRSLAHRPAPERPFFHLYYTNLTLHTEVAPHSGFVCIAGKRAKHEGEWDKQTKTATKY